MLGLLAIYGIFHVFLIVHLPLIFWISFVILYLILFFSIILLICTRVEGLYAPDDKYLDGDRLCLTCFAQWSVCTMYTMGLSVVVSMTFFLVGWILAVVELTQGHNKELVVWVYLYLFYILALLGGFLNRGYIKYREFEEQNPNLFTSEAG
jgi:hypothetical protein